jgi:Abortive infection alpha
MTTGNDHIDTAAEGLLPMLYKDALQPGVKQIGLALENVIGLVPALTLPAKYLSEKARLLMSSHLERYRQKLADKQLEKLIPVAPEIAVPIIEKLAYTTDQNLSALLIELLVKASQQQEVQKIHPSFIGIIANLSPDEARITGYLAKRINQNDWLDAHPVMELRRVHLRSKGYNRLKGPISGWERFVELDFDENVCAYADNLARLGLFEIYFDKTLDKKNSYTEIKQMVTGIADSPIDGYIIQLFEGVMEFTDFGKMFLRACAN